MEVSDVNIFLVKGVFSIHTNQGPEYFTLISIVDTGPDGIALDAEVEASRRVYRKMQSSEITFLPLFVAPFDPTNPENGYPYPGAYACKIDHLYDL